MHILIMASGSGGHVYPALSFKNKVKNHQVTYLTIKDGFENKVLEGENPYLAVKNQLKSYLRHPSNYITLSKEIKRNKELLKSIDVIVTFGGFVSFIGYLISKIYKKKLYLHEQNYQLGDANKFAKRRAEKVFLSFPHYKDKKMIYVGNPRMDDIKKKNIKHQSFNVLFFAGSLSSSSLNKVIRELLVKNFESKIHFYVISGEKQYSDFKDLNNDQITIIDYQKDMMSLMQNMDLVIMRAGATSLSEVIAYNLVAILIPSPNVKHNHQYENALNLVKSNAAIMIEEKDLTSEKLKEEIDKLSNDYLRYYQIKENTKKFYKQNVSENMLKVIENEGL